MNNLSWSFYQIWNESLENRAERELKKREHIWAGELGKPFVDRYLKMSAVKPTNPPNARSLRKFEAGNLMEWVVKMVLLRAGIFLNTQEWVKFQYPGLLRVTGKLDHEAGGQIDWGKAEEQVKELDLPEFFDRATLGIITKLGEQFPNGMNKIILEVKSLSSFQFDIRERVGTPQKHHALQLFHYLKSKNYKEGHVVYICKDDLRMIEFGVLNPSPWEDVYKADIEKMTEFIKKKVQPPKEKLVVFDEEAFKFSKNWGVEYSNYLKLLYGYERPDIFSDEYKSKVAKWNRTIGRAIANKNMTKLNLETLKEIEAEFPNVYEIIAKGQEMVKKKLIEVEEENGGNNEKD